MLKITIRKNDTLEQRVYTDVSGCDRETAEYLWCDGNYACDCNRALFFARAADQADPIDTPCGMTAFDVEVVHVASGDVLHTELDEAPSCELAQFRKLAADA